MNKKNLVLGKRKGKTRPDTRPIPVADWVGRGIFALSNLIIRFITNEPMDRQTDGRTDKASYRVPCPQLKKVKKEHSREIDFGSDK